MKEYVGLIFIIIGFIFIIFGIIGIYRFKDFYSRILVGSLIDTAGFTCVMVGVMIYKGFSFFSLKVFLILSVVLLLNPVSTHSITKSAYFSRYHIRKDD